MSSYGAQPMDRSPEAFAARLARCDRRMRALAYSMLGSADRMDDALQDAYLKAFRSYDRFRGESSFATWLGSIVYRTCIDHQRRASHHRQHLTDECPTDGNADDDRVGAMVEARLDVAAALRELSADHRAVLALADLEQFTVAETAEILGVPVGTVASRLNRARAALKQQFTMDSRTDSRMDS